MRGIGRAFARLPVAAAVMAGVFLPAAAAGRDVLAITAWSDIPAPGEERAAAVPRLRPPSGTAELALPQPLSPAEAARLGRVFAMQGAGDLAGAARLAAWLDDTSPLGEAMFGHVLADRYLNPGTRPDAASLRDWLARWPDLPDAAAIYRLLLARLPDGAPPPPAVSPPPVPPPAVEAADVTAQGPRRNPELDRDVHDAARTRGAAGVLRLLARTPGLTADYAALLRGEAAQILFTGNRDAEALTLADGAAVRSALAGLAGGLAAWRAGQAADAGALFESGWRATATAPGLRAACAFWAGRARLVQDDPDGARAWMRRAAGQRGTFYGMLARRRLGLRGLAGGGSFRRDTIGQADVEAVAATAPGLRAFALLQAGARARAAAELRLLWPAARQVRALARAVMLVGEQAQLDDVAEEFGDLLAAADGQPRVALPLAVPDLHPAGGFRVDPAMLYGIARTESNFDAGMVSSAGALGLLQIMPETARDLLGGGPDTAAALLHDPAFNLDLGQRYIVFLASQEPVNGDLIALLASYNAGLGSFARWAPQIRDGGDPLLFIEAIPIDETRAYVPRVLAYTWQYAARLRLPAPSLDELAAGLWPRYHARAALLPAVLAR